MSLKRDSVQKILGYLENASKNIMLSKLFFRDYTCPSGCGGCCPRFSLDYFEGSERWEKFKELYPEHVDKFTSREVDGVTVWSDLQEDHNNHYCKHLNLKDGRCGIHKSNPFTCEFELIKISYNKLYERSLLINKLFGRGWAYRRTDGGKGAKCEMLPFNYDKLKRDLKLLEELKSIEDLFGTKSKLSLVIDYIKTNLPTFKKGILPTKNILFKTKNEQDLWT